MTTAIRASLDERAKKPGNAIHEIEQMDDVTHLKRLAQSLFDGLNASRSLTAHTQQVLGGWEECKGCEAANEECDGSLCCDQAKAWQARVNAAGRTW